MPSLLRISDATSLGLHAMAIMANSPEKLVSAHEIASRLQISENHLQKVCQRLHKAGLIDAVRGPKGGVKLSRPAEQVRLVEIYEAIEGPMKVEGCLLGKPTCGRTCCLLGELLGSINNQVTNYLKNTTLAQLSC